MIPPNSSPVQTPLRPWLGAACATLPYPATRSRGVFAAQQADNAAVLAVCSLAAGDVPAVTRIVCDLPEYFTSDVPGQVERDISRHGGWVLTDSGDVAGFAVAARRSPGAAEILWMAVDPSRRGRGFGTVLLDRMLGELAADGVSVVEVKTLDRSAGYQPYEATRAFWERKGFVQIDTIDPLPGWQPGNPAAIYIAALRPTR
jgi:GNAT superfamily N-acetyltransferase